MVNGECPEVCRKFSIEKIVPYHNEFFTTKAFNIQDFEIWIYDRWGELIFTSKNVDNWWDGTYKGNPCQIDVYVWKARYSILSENGDTDVFNKVGRVSLIR